MNNKRFYIIGFALMILLQIYLPASLVWQKEQVIRSGSTFNFRTAPIDPNDPFRGKYIILAFEDNRFEVSKTPTWENGQNIFVSVSEDQEGFAKIKAVSAIAPTKHSDYFETTVRYVYSDNDNQELVINFPFDRYYMEERKAPEAEAKYRDAQWNPDESAVAVVKVKDGEAVLQDIQVNKVSLIELLEN